MPLRSPSVDVMPTLNESISSQLRTNDTSHGTREEEEEEDFALTDQVHCGEAVPFVVL